MHRLCLLRCAYAIAKPTITYLKKPSRVRLTYYYVFTESSIIILEVYSSDTKNIGFILKKKHDTFTLRWRYKNARFFRAHPIFFCINVYVSCHSSRLIIRILKQMKHFFWKSGHHLTREEDCATTRATWWGPTYSSVITKILLKEVLTVNFHL